MGTVIRSIPRILKILVCTVFWLVAAQSCIMGLSLLIFHLSLISGSSQNPGNGGVESNSNIYGFGPLC